MNVTEHDHPGVWGEVRLPAEAIAHVRAVIAQESNTPFEPRDVIGVSTSTVMFGSTSGPWGGLSGAAMTNFDVIMVRLRSVTLCFSAPTGYPGRPTREADYLGCALTKDVPEKFVSHSDYDVFIRPGKRITLNPEPTATDLAQDLLRIAEAAGMPDSYYFSDSRIARACFVLGIDPGDALENDLDDLFAR